MSAPCHHHVLSSLLRGFSLAFVALITLAACGNDKSASSADDTVCTPSCASGCGVADGCGGICACTEPACEVGRPCPSDACGMCAANESCVGDTCVCAPSCDEDSACLADGCGGTCACPDGYVQDAKGRWVPPEQCTDNCAVAGWVCGELCGQACGGCVDGVACELGICEGASCDGSRCDDGCECKQGTTCDASGACVAEASCTDTCTGAGRTCGSVCGESCGGCADALSCIEGACAEAVNCPTCSLKLALIEKTVFNGRVLEAVLALDYQPVEGEPRPRLADFRIALEGDAQLMRAEVGKGLSDAGKQLYTDPKTQKPWKRRADGTYQLMAFSAGTTEVFSPGRLLTLRFAHSEEAPLGFSLQRRAETFAPQLADSALQTSAYDGVVRVTP